MDYKETRTSIIESNSGHTLEDLYDDAYEIGYKEGESSSKNIDIRNAIEKAWVFIEGHYFDSSKKPEDIKSAQYFFYNVMFKKLLNIDYGERFVK